ncbi:MAG: hypothetical protein CM1200mP24_01700 [Gammaproteobacteria bacterium]|nr:MAG: hypothetical protein CM1200mP24_01700 [Gammaproteobacteria bacterium]
MTKAAYFRDYKGVVHAEFTEFFPDSPVAIFSENNLDWLKTDIEEPDFTSLARLSFVQGIFRKDKAGLRVLSCDPRFSLTNEFVSGNKYQGKTNETVTQLAINLASITTCLNPTNSSRYWIRWQEAALLCYGDIDTVWKQSE